jgi:hypothetical protein
VGPFGIGAYGPLSKARLDGPGRPVRGAARLRRWLRPRKAGGDQRPPARVPKRL